ncbi:MAG: chitobiase/beta-hexosaminidase C-terminal domain-containing protein [Chthoniobacter sp.]
MAAATAEIRAETPPPICNRVRFQLTAGGGKDIVAGKIEGSNGSRTEGFVTLAEIKAPPVATDWGELKFENSKVYRYLRCTLPRDGQGKLGKVEFYEGDRLIAGDKEGILVHYFCPTRRTNARWVTILSTPPPITLQSATPGAWFRYTLDGTTPTRTRGYVYCGAISVQPGIQLKGRSLQERHGG